MCAAHPARGHAVPTRTRTIGALLTGIIILLIGMIVIERIVSARCSGVAAHRYHEIWLCWHLLEFWMGTACVAGLASGLVSRKRGVIVGVLVAAAGLALYSALYRYPFGSDYLATLRHGFVFLIPCAVGCILGARFTGSTWRYAL